MSLACAGCGKTNLDLARQCFACGAALEGLGPNSMIGTTILGNYKLVSVLGTGGMSVVYKAQHRVTEQEVAIKILPPDLAVYDDVKARFVEEARTLAKLEHPNIVALHNFVEAEGRLHLIMQYAPGKTFEQLISERVRVPWPEAVRIGLGVLDALIYAHARGVVHRDIKPSNVLVRPDGSVKVMDFGIAKITTSTKLTATGQTMGTVRYMSPEQVRGKDLDGRSDLYSLGVTIYEAICGATPFDGESHFEIMQKHLVAAVPPIATHGVEVPKMLSVVLGRALAKPLGDRYATAETFARELAAVLPKEEAAKITSSAAVSAAKRQAKWRLLAAGSGVVVLVASTIAWVLFHRAGDANASGKDGGAVSVAQEPRWPEPYRAVKELTFAVDKTYSDARLHVLSVARRDPDALRDLYRLAHSAYGSHLVRVSKLPASRRPLTLVVVAASFLQDAKRFAGATAKTRVWYAPSEATLFVADMPGFEREDLPGGIALHLCPAALSAELCQSIADSFEKEFRGSPK